MEEEKFECINPNAAGIDIGSGEHHRLCSPICSRGKRPAFWLFHPRSDGSG